MKKSNSITFLSLCFLIAAVTAFMFFGKASSTDSDTDVVNSLTQNDVISVSSSSAVTKTTEIICETHAQLTEVSKTETQNISPEPITVSMADTLFIGDSRTVGLMEYGGIEDADFFCTVGMSVYNIHKKTVSVPNVGKVTLTELLNSKQYSKIYIMLGINEVGYKTDSTVEKYSELIEFIKSKEPDAIIFLQANLHVTKSRSDSDKIVTNNAIDGLNAELSELADGKTKFYIDVNPLFDDASGNLSSDKSEDSAHLYAKYYREWGKWIISQTATLIGEG